MRPIFLVTAVLSLIAFSGCKPTPGLVSLNQLSAEQTSKLHSLVADALAPFEELRLSAKGADRDPYFDTVIVTMKSGLHFQMKGPIDVDHNLTRDLTLKSVMVDKHCQIWRLNFYGGPMVYLTITLENPGHPNLLNQLLNPPSYTYDMIDSRSGQGRSFPMDSSTQFQTGFKLHAISQKLIEAGVCEPLK